MATVSYWKRQAALAAKRNGVPVSLFLRQINQESGFNPNAQSSAGAIGIAQIVPKYHPTVDPRDPQASLNYAAHLMRNLHDKYGNWVDPLSVYNSGRPWAQGQKIGETNNYVHSIMSGARLPSGGTAPTAASPSGGGNQNSQFMASMALMQNAQALTEGKAAPFDALTMAMMRQQAGAAQDTFGSQPSPNTDVSTPAYHGKVKFEGNIAGENSGFLTKLGDAAASVGATRIRVTSGYRSPAHNAEVGGAKNSNHMYGRAMDGDAYIPGHGWVPLGVALQSTASKFGLRSGMTFLYNGRPDAPHVDDGYNQRH